MTPRLRVTRSELIEALACVSALPSRRATGEVCPLPDLCQLRKENEPKTEAVAPKPGHVEDIIFFGKRK